MRAQNGALCRNTAVDDGLIRRNPCRIKGAGQEKSPERPVLTISQVFDLTDAIAPRYQALIYQHRTTERDRFIAAAMSEIVKTELSEARQAIGHARARSDRDAS